MCVRRPQIKKLVAQFSIVPMSAHRRCTASLWRTAPTLPGPRSRDQSPRSNSPLHRFARARLNDDVDATKEIVHVTLSKAIQKLHTYRGEAALFTWLSDRHAMNWGFEVERLSAAYRYASSVDLFGFSASFDGVSSSVRRNITMFPTSRTYSLHVSDRISFGSSAVAEFGLRWDKQTHLPTERYENQLSPRLSFLYQLGPRSNLRASWGRYFQSQGLLQFQVEDGVREFFPAQSAKHYIVSLEHRLRNDLVFRVETYRKTLPDLRPRYENLFNSLSLLPEGKYRGAGTNVTDWPLGSPGPGRSGYFRRLRITIRVGRRPNCSFMNLSIQRTELHFSNATSGEDSRA